jgi:hypothetical protein
MAWIGRTRTTDARQGEHDPSDVHIVGIMFEFKSDSIPGALKITDGDFLDLLGVNNRLVLVIVLFRKGFSS